MYVIRLSVQRDCWLVVKCLLKWLKHTSIFGNADKQRAEHDVWLQKWRNITYTKSLQQKTVPCNPMDGSLQPNGRFFATQWTVLCNPMDGSLQHYGRFFATQWTVLRNPIDGSLHCNRPFITTPSTVSCRRTNVKIYSNLRHLV